MKQEAPSPTLPLPTHRFPPPFPATPPALIRSSLLHDRLPGQRHNKKVIIIEAQAGQGKTTLARQFLDTVGTPFLWLQTSTEDIDPRRLFCRLLHDLAAILCGFSSPHLAGILATDAIAPEDIPCCADILLRDLAATLPDHFYLVFDDLQRIDSDTPFIALLQHLIDASPPQLHFILISRRPVELRARAIRNGDDLIYLNTFDLALDIDDIDELFCTVLRRKISRAEAAEVLHLTGGWIMGILLICHPISGQNPFWRKPEETDLPAQQPPEHLLDYFYEEVLSSIPETFHPALLRLSFLHEVPADLAEALSGIAGTQHFLARMARDNAFIYEEGEAHHIYRFHGLFREFLQQRGRQLLSQREIADIHHHEARYHLSGNCIEKALASYKKSGDLKTMDSILKAEGMGLLARNRFSSLRSLLQSIPEKSLNAYPWLTLFTGLMHIDHAAEKAFSYIERARPHFAETGEADGELLALAKSIHCHLLTMSRFHEGERLLPRAEQLLERHRYSLPAPIVVLASLNVAAGHCFFNGEMGRARHFIHQAANLAARNDLRDFLASAHVIKAAIDLVSGTNATFVREAEACFALFDDPMVSEGNRLAMRMLFLCHLSMNGDQRNFRILRQALLDAIQAPSPGAPLASQIIEVWTAAGLASRGLAVEALRSLNTRREAPPGADGEQEPGEHTAWRAFALSLSEAQAAAGETLATIRPESCRGPFPMALALITMAAAHSRLGRHDDATSALVKALSIARKIPSAYLTICALFNLANSTLANKGEEAALTPLQAGLSLMKINGYTSFWTWEPQMMRRLLGMAVKHDIEERFTQSLARTRLGVNFTREGEPLTLLTFTLLDHFEMSMDGKILFRAKDLTLLQRELLGLLLTARGQRIAQEKVLLELWPDTRPNNARKSFDSLLARLRQLLTTQFNVPAKEYLYMQKGILCLANYQIDALQFLEAARSGLYHYRNGERLQACKALYAALSLWKGGMPDDTFHSEQVFTFNDTLSNLLIRSGLTLATILAEAQRDDEAIAVIERILKHNCLEDRLTTLLYQLHRRNNTPLKAKDILERYRKALLKADYSEEEAGKFLDAIVECSQSDRICRIW